VRGDLGRSWSQPGRGVGEILADHLPNTVALTGVGLLVQLALGVGLAATSIRRIGSAAETAVSSLALALHAIPQFCLGLLLLWPLAFRAGWFPASGVTTAPWEGGGGLLDRLHHLALPASCLGVGGAAAVARLLRVRWSQELGSRYVVAGRARGLAERRLLWRHALPGAAGPLCTAIGLSLPGLLGGAVVVEQVFNWPGLGTVLLEAVSASDLPLLTAANLVFAVLVASGTLLGDLLWVAVDPRVRLR
jgi:peptide/nickel transport system permease protein